MRRFLSYQMSVAQIFVVALPLGTPYLIIGAIWSSTHAEHLHDMDGVDLAVSFLGSVVSWPVLLFADVHDVMHQRHHRLAYTGIVSAVVVVVGLLALNFPVFLDAYDQWAFQIKCGTGYATDLTQAAAVVGEHDFVDQCGERAARRRMWTIPLVAISGLVLLVVTLASAIASARESLVPHRDTA